MWTLKHPHIGGLLALWLQSRNHEHASEGIVPFPSLIVLETRVLVSRRIEDKNESLGLGVGLGS